jgi:thymidine phosphorylase
LSARGVAESVRRLGGGRACKEDSIDHSVGVVLLTKPGAAVEPGQPLCLVHAADAPAAEAASLSLLAAYEIAAAPPRRGALVLERIE